MKNKYNKELGLKIQQHLIGLDLEFDRVNNLNSEATVVAIASSYTDILKQLGLTSPEFDKTPNRIASMFVNEIFYGLSYDNFPNCSLFTNEFKYDGVISQKDINIMSFCEHHFVPFEGVAEVSFLPNECNIIGLSHLNTICDFFARRPQIQERLTSQIFETLKFILGTDNVSVTIKAKHTCISFRGSNNKNTLTETKMNGGVFLK